MMGFLNDGQRSLHEDQLTMETNMKILMKKVQTVISIDLTAKGDTRETSQDDIITISSLTES